MTSVSGGGLSASFTYDGDGNRVKGTVAGVSTVYISNTFEWTGSTSTMKKYYYASGVRVALRTGTGTGITGLEWLVGDHLGSTAITANASGAKSAEVRYKAWGEQRYASGTTPTTYRFTGQRQEALLGGLDGLYFYNARWYDSYLSRFIQPDTIVPEEGTSQAWDRYAYTLNNPLKYIDPSGHDAWWCETNSCQAVHYNQMGYRKSDVPLREGKNKGKGIFYLYIRLNNKPGWWNRNKPGSMTPDEFLGIMMLYERSGIAAAHSLIIEAAKNQIWMDASGEPRGHPAFCQGQTCLNGIFNFLGDYGGKHNPDRVKGLLKGSVYPPALIQSLGERQDRMMDTARNIGTDLAAYDPSRVQYSGDVPYHWGSDRPFYDKVAKANPQLGWEREQIVLYLSRDFLIYTVNQSNYWSSKP